MPLDEGIFQDQGLKLAVGNDDVKVVDLGHHGPGLFGVGGQIGKILAHPVFQGLGLAHIDDLALGVLHDVYARLEGQAVGFFFQFVKGHRGAASSLLRIRERALPFSSSGLYIMMA